MEKLIRSTLCYIENNGCYLMLFRDRKKDDINEGKWIGIGGKIEDGETPEECNTREVLEETGLILRSSHFHGIIQFRSDEYTDEDMYLYSSDDFEPADENAALEFSLSGMYIPPECEEGRLEWIRKTEIFGLPLWEGDKAFLKQLTEGRDKISMTISYIGDSCIVTDMEE